MTFNSLQFLIFFPIVAVIHFILPYRWRWLWLLLASCYFYMVFIPPYILILFFLILVDYTAALMIERTSGKKRKMFLLLSILATCSVLFIFKYFDFFNNTLKFLTHFWGGHYSLENGLGLILPLGLSFHTFQSLNYVIEVYRGNQKAERHLGIYALYVMFFPQLVSGPIERARHLLPQFYERHDFDYQRITDGLKLMLWGMFQKVVIADRLALVVNQVYNNAHGYTGLSLVVATVFFAFQIYCDFSGYSDIAVGGAQVLGFRLIQNFNRPYFATSISEFWKRWHISLSTWFRDYVYIPLGGNRVPLPRWQINILITFILSGLWHGSNWTFILWGAVHGFYYLFSFWTRSLRKTVAGALRVSRLPAMEHSVKVLITFTLVCFAWIFFRANNIHDAGYVISNLFTGWHGPLIFQPEKAGFIGLKKPEFILAVFLIIFLLVVHLWQSRLSESQCSVRSWLSGQPLWVRWGTYLAMTLIIMNLGIMAQIPFIYFQF